MKEIKKIACNAKKGIDLSDYGVIIKTVARDANTINEKGVEVMVNINKLKGKIVEKGLKVERVAELMGIDKSTLYRKLGNSENITIKDADKLVEILEISTDEATAIFFSQYVA